MRTTDTGLEEALQIATEVALKAGALLRAAQWSDHQNESHDPESSHMDLMAEQLIRAKLSTFNSNWGFRAEEEPTLNRVSQSARGETWLVDPNDGTSAFKKGQRGASVSIALIRDQKPVLGVIYAYTAPNDHGDLFTWAVGCGQPKRNHVPIPDARWKLKEDRGLALVSNSFTLRRDSYHALLTPWSFRGEPGIAYRLALCAAGDADLAISLAGSRDFDFAAGHALLRGAGGVLLDESGKEILYNSVQAQRVSRCFGGSRDICLNASKIEWNRVIQAPTTTLLTHLVEPRRRVDTIPVHIHDRINGALWGWLTSLPSSDASRELLTLRRYALNMSQDQSLIKRPFFIELIIRLGQSLRQRLVINLHTHFSPQMIQSNYEQATLAVANGLRSGRAHWGTRKISELLAKQLDVPPYFWVDAERIIEQIYHVDLEFREALLKMGEE